MSNYDDIIKHDRYMLKYHLPQPIQKRAVQFSPFAALTGFDEEIDETARITDTQINISEDDAVLLNQNLSYLLKHKYEEIPVKLTYFKSDSKKEGGSYIDYKGVFKYFREDTHCLVFQDGKEISIDNIEKIKI